MNDTEKVIQRLSGVVQDKGLLPTISDYETLEKAISRFGKNAQIDMAIEEMSELTKALLKERRVSKKHGFTAHPEMIEIAEENISEEMADVIIMMVQLQIIYNNNEKVSSFINRKVKRLKSGLD